MTHFLRSRRPKDSQPGKKTRGRYSKQNLKLLATACGSRCGFGRMPKRNKGLQCESSIAWDRDFHWHFRCRTYLRMVSFMTAQLRRSTIMNLFVDRAPTNLNIRRVVWLAHLPLGYCAGWNYLSFR